MSTTVDQRVVEMRFDNKHFESNVATTMSTLDKLKRALHLDGASKGLENVNAAANKVNMSGLASGVETVRAKFSALEVIGVTALANITNSAVNAGKKIVSALTIDPVKTGFNEYEMKMDSIKTIVNSTGRDLKDVNKLLEELNEYSDQTIYSFKDMTQNIGKFTNAGVGLEDAVLAIKGISNEAAVSGASAAEASRAMYNFSQALSAGYVKLIDWKSIENANMATKEFKQQLIDTAVELGVVTQAGDMYTTSTGKSFNATKNFNDTLQEQWMTTDVLITTLGKYADSTTDIGKKAFAAAQEVTKMTQMWDVLKETAQSGWAKTWELIVGDLEGAKKIFTPLTNFFSDIINAMSDARNRALDIALNFSKYWDSITSKTGNIKKVVAAVDTVTDKLEYFQDVVTKVWRGDFNNQGDNPDRRDLLKAAGYDPRVVQDLVNKGYQYKLTMEDIEASHKKFGLTLVTSTEETEKLTTKLEELDEETLTNLGLTEDEIELYKALAKEAKRTGKTIDEIADTMSKNNGREVLIDSFKNIGTAIVDTVNIIKSSLAEIFEIPTTSDIAIRLHGMIMSLHEFSENIQLINKETNELNETGKKFKSIFKGAFAVIDIILTIIKGPAKLAFEIFKEILSFFGTNVLDILAKVGDGMVTFRDTVDKVISTITKFIVENVAKWIEKFKETEFFKTTADWFADASERISGALGNISNKINNFSASGLGKTLKTIVDFISKIIKSVANSKVVIFAVDAIHGAFDKLKSFFTGFKLPEFNLENLRMFFTNFTKLGDNIKTSDKKGLGGLVDGIGKTLGGHTSLVKAKTNFQNGVESFFSGFVNFWLKIGDKLKEAFKICQDALKGIVKFIFGTEEVSLPVIMDAVEKFLWILTLFKAIKLMDSFVAPFENITSALDNVANSLKWRAIGDAFKSMALALGVLTVCILVLSSIDDMGKAWQAAGMLAGLLIIMGGVIAGLGFLSSKIGGLDVKGMLGISLSLLLLIGAIALMVKTLKDLDDLKLNDPIKTFGYLAATLLALSVGIALVSKAGSANFASIAGLLTLVGALKLILDVITAYDEYDWFGKTKAIQKMMEMLVMLSVAVNIATRGVKAGSNIKGLAFLILAMVISLKIMLDAIKDIAETPDEDLKKGGRVITQMLTLLTGILTIANLTTKGTVLKKGQKNVNHFTGFAVALLAVCAAIWLLGKMDPATLEQGGRAVSQILLIMTGVLAVLGKNCKGLKTGPIIAMIVGFGILMAEMALLVKLLEDVSWESKISSFVAIGGMLLVMAVVLKQLSRSRIKAKTIYKWIGALGALSLVVAELAIILYAIKDIIPLTAMGSAVALSALLLAMAGTLKILSKHNIKAKNIYKWIGALAVLGLVVAELAAILYLFDGINPLSAVGSAVAISTLLLAMAGTLKILSTSRVQAKNIYKWIGALAVLSLVVGELAFVLYSIKDMNPVNAMGNAIALSTLLVTLAGVVTILSKFNVGFNGGAVATIALLGLVLFELVGVLDLAEHIDPVAAMPRIKALSTLLVVLAGVALLLDKFNVKSSTGAVGSIALLGAVLFELVGVLDLAEHIDPAAALPRIEALSALLVILAGVATGLDKLNVKFSGGAVGAMALLALVLGEIAGVLILANKINPEGAMTRVLALSTLMGVLTLLLIPLSLIGKLAAGSFAAIGALAVLGLVLAELTAIMILANRIDTDGAMTRVLALSVLMSVLTLLLIPLSLIGSLAVTALAGIGALAVLMASLLIVVGILYLMEGLQNGVENARILTTMATVLTLLLIPLSLIGALIAPALMGVGALAVLMSSLLIVVGVLALMDGLQNAQANTNILITLLNTLTTTLVTVSLLGPLAVIGTVCLGALIGMLGVMTTFVIALGVIMEYCPMIEKFVDNGLGLIIKLAGGLGEMISAFGVGLSSGLPEIGQNLTDFANNLKGFLNVINNDITDDTVIKAGKLALVVAALMGVGVADGFNIVDGLKKLFGGESSLEALGSKLSDFGNNISDFVSAINDFDADSAANMESLAVAIKSLNDVCANNNFGDGQLEKVGEQTASFAGSMKSVAESLKDLTDDDVANIKRAADGAKEIARLNDSIPKTGGGWQDIAGSADLKTWGQSIEAFADSLINYSIKVSGKSFDAGAVKASAEAAQPLADLTTSLGKVGGLWQEITGQTDLAGFGDVIVPFADDLIAYNNKIVGASIDAEAIKNSAAGAAALVEVLNALPKEGGWFSGERDLEGFGKGLTPLATGLVDYSAAAVTIDETKIEAIKNSGTAVDEIVNVVNKIPKTGGTAGWFGEHDPYAFGSGVSALATGIKNMCAVAATITQEDIDAIGFSKTAVEKIVELVNKIPTEFNSDSSTAFKTAVTAIHNACKQINTISTAGYDYSGIDSVKTAISKLTNIITTDAANSLKTTFDTIKKAVNNVSKIASTISTLNDKSYGGVAVLNTALDELSNAKVQAVINTFNGKAAEFKAAINGIVSALQEGLSSADSKTTITNAMIELIDSGLEALDSEDKLSAAKTAGTNLASSAASGASDKTSITNANTAGQNLGSGYVRGINAKQAAVYAAGFLLGRMASAGINAGQDSNSPSKLAIKSGKWLGEGYAIGIDKMNRLVGESGSNLGTTATDSLSYSISRISDMISNDIDSQPTIRPVLDLSDVKSGASTIGNMLNLDSSVGVRANIGAISASMANRQNGNDNLISAINKLAKSNDKSGDTYNFNGFSYNEGSDVADAIQTLVRAAKMEGRT